MFNDLAATNEELEMHTRQNESSNEKFTCPKCAGTGFYKGIRVHQEKSHCFACKGKGFFMTSEADRRKAKAKREEKKQGKAEQVSQKLSVFAEQHQDLFAFMLENKHWNNFFCSLLDSAQKYGTLTDGQLAAAYRSMDKTKATKAEKAAKDNVQVDLTKLNEVFSNASENGLKKPVLRIADMVVSKAPDHGRNAGFLYVKFENEYAGKISPEGIFMKSFNTPEAVESELREFCKAPMEAAVKYGRETGKCACCGRTLTDPKSIEIGIGPICLENWF